MRIDAAVLSHSEPLVASSALESAVAAAELPPQRALDEQLHAQRLRLVRGSAIALAVLGGLWCVTYLGYFLKRALPAELMLLVSVQAGMLSAAGVIGVLLCRANRLRPAVYAVVLPLIATATLNLAFVANAEGAGVITYCVAVSIAAFSLEGRDWLGLGAVLGVAALIGMLLHVMPIAEPVSLPPALAIASLFVATPLGLAYPTGLFWLFSQYLTASRTEAWEQARRATEANRVITERTRELEVRSAQLEAKHAELSDFMYVVSHDLRAPLINLEGFSRALQENIATLEELLHAPQANRGPRAVQDAWPPLHAEITESLDFILRSVAKMDFLVKGLLELSRIDSRPSSAQTIDTPKLVEDILGSLHFHVSARRIDVIVDPLPMVVGDPVRLSQVFSNLIDNAIKYMKPLGDARLHIGCQPNGVAYRFFVRDNGIGIRAEDHAKIFRLFTRVGTTNVPGEGMGLTAVKKILEKHGGRIWVESELGRGSTFWFTLPMHANEERMGNDATGAH